MRWHFSLRALLLLISELASLADGSSSSHGTASRHVHRRTLPSQLTARHPSLLHRLNAASRRPAFAPPADMCPDELQAVVNATGRLSIKACGAVGDKRTDDSIALVRAMAMARTCRAEEVRTIPAATLAPTSCVQLPHAPTRHETRLDDRFRALPCSA
jgi:hypothetical protein